MNKELDELLTHCIRCGFCLEACPTFVETGSELESPRGRIYLVRSADNGVLNWQEDVKPHLDLCLGCRACETACPSGVEYGAILELARDRIESQSASIPKKALLEVTTRPWLLNAQLTASQMLPRKRIPNLVSRIISGESPQADLPKPQKRSSLPPLRDSDLPPVKGEVYLLKGCAMRVLFGRVQECSARILRRCGYVVKEVDQGCCGALHAHNGQLADAADLASKLVEAFPEPLPIIVDSAGCGSTMKEYNALLGGNDSASGFAKRVFDISEFLAIEGFQEALALSEGVDRKVAYHEACHLVHGQKISAQPKALLAAIPRLRLAPLAEADMCCGSAGIYNVVQPEMARKLLDRKWSRIEESEANIVVSGNPGCHSWIAQASREHGGRPIVLHTTEMLEASFIGLEPFLD